MRVSLIVLAVALFGSNAFADENPGGCPVGQWPDQHGVCRPMGGYVDAAHGGYGYAGRQCADDVLHSYDQNATVGYWTQSVYGRHSCVALEGNEFDGPYVRCSCGATECIRGYTATKLGRCVRNTAIIANDAESGDMYDLVESGATLPMGKNKDGSNAVLGIECDPAHYFMSDEEGKLPERKKHTTKGIWVANNSRYATNLCKQSTSSSSSVKCTCGTVACEEGWKPNEKYQGVGCVPDPDYSRLNKENPQGNSGGAPIVATQVCIGGKQTIGNTEYDCAKDASGNFSVVVNVNIPCHSDVIAQVTNASAGDWRRDANGGYACKTSDESDAFERCKCHITACKGEYEAATDGSSCQPKPISQPNPTPTQKPVDTKSISDLAGRLAKVEGQFGLSKWRTADGEFNKARLASDLTAGVVLGTTGALVTSSVVKKKQVKEGFEALECTIGGQHVGDWGDTFHISGK